MQRSPSAGGTCKIPFPRVQVDSPDGTICRRFEGVTTYSWVTKAQLTAAGYKLWETDGSFDKWVRVDGSSELWVQVPKINAKSDDAPAPETPETPETPSIIPPGTDEDPAAVIEARLVVTDTTNTYMPWGGHIADAEDMREAGRGHDAAYDQELEALRKIRASVGAQMQDFESHMPEWREDLAGDDAKTQARLEKFHASMQYNLSVMDHIIAELDANRDPPPGSKPVLDPNAPTPDPGNDDPGNQDPGNQDPGIDDPSDQDPGNQDPGGGDAPSP